MVEWSERTLFGVLAAAGLALASSGSPAAAEEPAAALQAPAAPALSGAYLHLSDIHLDPLYLPPLDEGLIGQDRQAAEDKRNAAVRALARQLEAAPVEQWEAILSTQGDGTLTYQGNVDTNYYLLKATLEAAAKAGVYDYVLFTGDYLEHDFIADAYRSGGIANPSRFAADTVAFVNLMIEQHFPGVPIIAALGNNDSGIGDYALQQDGAFLDAVAASMPGVSGSPQALADFKHGGYYTLPHPTVANHDFLVLSVFWSKNYPSFAGPACSLPRNTAAGEAQQKYLDAALSSTSNKVTLLMHIPPGMDGYSGHDHKPSGTGTSPMWCTAAQWESGFESTLAGYRNRLAGGFAGHTHMDEFRVLADSNGPYLAIRMAPSVTTYNSNNPTFTVAAYDAATAETTDYTVHYLVNSGPGISPTSATWGTLYNFSTGYGLNGYTAANLQTAASGIRSGSGNARSTFTKSYRAGRSIPGGYGDWPYFACALDALNESDYVACVKSTTGQ